MPINVDVDLTQPPLPGSHWQGMAWARTRILRALTRPVADGAALLLCAAAAAAATTAVRAEVMQTAACSKALSAVEARTEAVLATRRQDPQAARGQDAQLMALRRESARACLGAEAGSPASQRPPPPSRAPLSVVKPVPAAPAVGVPPPASDSRSSGTPSAASRPPLSVTSCDAAGCWISDGTRMPKAGAQLIGPRGLCTVQGGLLNCP